MSSSLDLPKPTGEVNRILCLDALRGFALLGILLLNIIGFGLLSPSYSNPAFDLADSGTSSLVAWAIIELIAEGAMRALFSILFGAGVMLFVTGVRAKSAWTHYKRTFWLLLIGLFDAYILLWNGDILVTYAIAGALLYLVRNQSAKTLFVMASVLIILMSALHGATQFSLKLSYDASQRVALARADGQATSMSKEDLALAAGWEDFIKDFTLSPEGSLQETAQRTESYNSVLDWTAYKNAEIYGFILPVFLLWDALAMMIIGMGLYKKGVLQAQRHNRFYINLMATGFSIGLLTNGFEVVNAIQSNFDIFSTFAQMQFTYHIGRLGMALGYIGLFGWLCTASLLEGFIQRLAAVGRMALTNYLMHSLICAVLFTGLGFGLLGHFERIELYAIVASIWLFQVWLSPIWLSKFKFGPVEWVWRALTYNTLPDFKR
ncbi:MAG: DUF418 domain-containing protein [Pseudohongiellaceae bacterium]